MGSFKLGEKEIKVPVIQGGMGIGIVWEIWLER